MTRPHQVPQHRDERLVVGRAEGIGQAPEEERTAARERVENGLVLRRRNRLGVRGRHRQGSRVGEVQGDPSVGPGQRAVATPEHLARRAELVEHGGGVADDTAGQHEGLEGWFFPRYSEFFFPLLLIYFIAFWTWKGTTVGGVVMKLRIVKINGAPFEAADAIVRALAGVLSFAAVGLGVLWILRSDDLAHDGLPARQGWHDKAVGTFVIKE